ncbi:MAG: hypothetical protein Q7V31_06295 [Parvibaculum sp.]|uniref:hypothetical protein n=1 Tax=Parvibaculum sp. TaxID=2024848 RepID=UPI00271AFAFB|nr:hypothetical protein [Parvibaculum sp.]MDO8838522.1 hypothetical protein [Parvibaculum sp.]
MTETPERIWGVPAPVVGGLLMLVVVTLSAVFIWQSYAQLHRIEDKVDKLWVGTEQTATFEKLDPVGKCAAVLAYLDLEVIKMRHNRTVVALQSRTWMKFLTSMFGAVLVTLGAIFVLGQVSAPHFRAHVEGRGVNVALASASPGLVIVVIGAGLLVASMIVHHEVSQTDQALFIEGRIDPNDSSGRR